MQTCEGKNTEGSFEILWTAEIHQTLRQPHHLSGNKAY